MSKYNIEATESNPWGFDKEAFELDVAKASEFFYSHFSLDYLYNACVNLDGYYEREEGGDLWDATLECMVEVNKYLPTEDHKKEFIYEIAEYRFDRRIRRNLYIADYQIEPEDFDDEFYVAEIIDTEMPIAWSWFRSNYVPKQAA